MPSRAANTLATAATGADVRLTALAVLAVAKFLERQPDVVTLLTAPIQSIRRSKAHDTTHPQCTQATGGAKRLLVASPRRRGSPEPGM